MGGRVASSSETRQHRGSFTSVLASALFEWLLIFMLFVYGAFGYLIMRFARYCELPIPCLLCSRIDNILGSEKAGFYWDMICRDHKLEMSSLVYCHFHEKLVDVRGMCESCLFSFATKDKSNAETYRLLVGKLGEEDLTDFDEDPLLENNKIKGLKHCCCCNGLWAPRRQAQPLSHTRSIGFDASDLDVPLSRGFSQERVELEKEFQISLPLAVRTHVGEKCEDSLVGFGYTELKITSDTESEIHASDNEDTRALISDDPLRDLILDSTQMEPFIAVSVDDSSCNKPVKLDVLFCEPSQKLSDLLPSDIIHPHNGPSVVSAPAIGHGLEELDWQEIDLKPHGSATKELIDIIDHEPNSSASTELINDNHVHIIPNGRRVSTDFLEDGLDINEARVVQTFVHGTDKVQESENSQIIADFNSSDVRSGLKDGVVLMPNNLDLSDAYQLAVSGTGRQLSGEKLTDQLSVKDSPLVSSDLKVLLSQFSRGFDLHSTGILSPRVSRNFDESKTYGSSASIGIKLLQKRRSLERNDSKNSLDRNESGVDSLDLSVLSEIEGESEFDRSKRQVEHDRKFIIALVKELEEERNASASAANEAMAMITRLQEEKAALQMEASQGLRMMEEQAEYDMDALDKLNDLVIEKEKEIQDLEAELGYYRTKYPNESFLDYVGDSASDASRDKKPRSTHSNVLAEDCTGIAKDPSVEVEDEMEYLSQCLKDLENKLSLFSSNTAYSDLKNQDHLEKPGDDSSDQKSDAGAAQANSEVDEDDVISQKDPFISEESSGNIVRVQLFKDLKSTGKGSFICTEADLAALVNEVSKLNERLLALEADQSFIECATKTLKNGQEGLIQEIVSHLRELRKIGIRRYHHSCLDDKRDPPES